MAKKEKKNKKDKLDIANMTDIEIKAEKDRIKSEAEKRIRSKKRERSLRLRFVNNIIIFNNNLCNFKSIIFTRCFYNFIRSKFCKTIWSNNI